MKKRMYQMLLICAVTTTLTACSPPPEGEVATLPQIREVIKAADAPLTLVHVWATWCDPCREEFPELLEAYAEARDRGFELVLVSGDDPNDTETVTAFLQEHQSPVNSLISTQLNQEFIELFSTNWAGALPASFFYNADGTLVEEWQGKRSLEHYMQTIDTLLKQGKE
jgi:thiol-disulfide isomerase/thioredoxin